MLIADFEQLDGAEAFVHPERMRAARGADRERRARRARPGRAAIVGELLAAGAPDDGFLAEIARRWDGVDEPDRAAGVAGDVVLLHVATMTNLFAALGWTLALLLLHPEVHAPRWRMTTARSSNAACSSRSASASARS